LIRIKKRGFQVLKKDTLVSHMCVLRLAAGLPQNKNHKLDNWFASEQLMIELSQIGILAMGTLGPNREKIVFESSKQELEKRARGEFELYQHKRVSDLVWSEPLYPKPLFLACH
jgi:hypothetical protein